MRETDIEQYLIRRVRELRGRQCKHVSPGSNGEPDRLVKLPGHPAALLELKAPGEEPTAQQWDVIGQWRAVGMLAEYADTRTKVDAFLRLIQCGGSEG